VRDVFTAGRHYGATFLVGSGRLASGLLHLRHAVAPHPNWGGYEWDGQRYDNVTAMLASMHDMGLFTGMNLHDVARPPFSDPAYSAGVVADDNPKSWPAFAAAMGVDPSTASVDFNIGNRTYAVALHEVLVTPLLQQGLDMCWYTSRGLVFTRQALYA
jgi:hypothetical protein